MNRACEASATRAALAMLTDHELRDIGATRADAAAEANRAFWDFRPAPTSRPAAIRPQASVSPARLDGRAA